MKINHETEILDYSGEPIPNQEGQPVTFRSVVISALNSLDPQLTAEKKVQAFQICMRMNPGKLLRLSLDEAKLVKDMAAKITNALIYGRICEILDPDSVESDDDEEEEDG